MGKMSMFNKEIEEGIEVTKILHTALRSDAPYVVKIYFDREKLDRFKELFKKGFGVDLEVASINI